MNNTRDPWQAIGGDGGIATIIRGYLDQSRLYQELLKGGARNLDTVFEQDRRWSKETIDQDSVLPAMFAVGSLAAARQNLVGIAYLVTHDEIDLPVMALARGCVEASARTLLVLDPEVSSKERFTRSYNESLHTFTEDAHLPGGAVDKFVDAASKMGIAINRFAKGRRRGQVRHFGDSERPSMEAVSRAYLQTGMEFDDSALKCFRRVWNGAAHAGFDVGVVAEFMGQPEKVPPRSLFSMTALTAYGTALEANWRHMGQRPLSQVLAEQSI